jgi:hypothetical protein
MTLRYEYEPGYCGELIASNGEVVCTFTDEPNEINARRLVACWNACTAMPTKDIEELAEVGNGVMQLIVKASDAIIARDDLLEALKGLLAVADHKSNTIPEVGWSMAQHKARAAIQKTEGEV